MRFGIIAALQFKPEESFVEKVRHACEEVRTARENGFEILAIGQHHLVNPFYMPSLWPYLGRLAAEAEGMWLASGIVLLPMHNPVDVAEQVMTMDAITGGRFICGVGLGYRDVEFQAFGVKPGERVARFLEALEIMKLIWTQEEVEYNGRFWQIPRVKVTTKPIQKPHPPIWIACNADSAVRRTGRLGHTWLINPHATVSTIERQWEIYKEGLKEGGHPMPSDVIVERELYIHEDRETAWREAEPYLYDKYQAYAAWGQDKALPGQEDFRAPIKELAKDRFIIGTPDDCIKELEKYRDRLGANGVIFRLQWPGMPHEKTLQVLRLMGEKVIPHFKR